MLAAQFGAFPNLSLVVRNPPIGGERIERTILNDQVPITMRSAMSHKDIADLSWQYTCHSNSYHSVYEPTRFPVES